MIHTCHANFCDDHCAPEKLMCLRHWRMVSPASQRAVLSAYRSGQCNDQRPSQEWFDAAHRAIAEVAQAERRPMSRRQRATLEDKA